jgi:hypothetical protein
LNRPFYRYGDHDLYYASKADDQLFPIESVTPTIMARANDMVWNKTFLV